MRLDLVLVVDDAAALTPWLPPLYDGLVQLFQQQAWSGIGIGLQRFDEVCDAQPHANLIVPIAPLPGNASALEAALPVAPTLSTSKTPALEGALQHARAWAIDHVEARVAVVLLTDANPGACDGLRGNLETEPQRLAREGYEGVPSVKTYVVGFGVMAALSTIAAAGGTDAALIGVTPADGEVLAALDGVRRAEQAAFCREEMARHAQ